MDEIQMLIRKLEYLLEEDRMNIREGLSGDLLEAYERYIDEEQSLFKTLNADVSSLI